MVARACEGHVETLRVRHEAELAVARGAARGDEYHVTLRALEGIDRRDDHTSVGQARVPEQLAAERGLRAVEADDADALGREA